MTPRAVGGSQLRPAPGDGRQLRAYAVGAALAAFGRTPRLAPAECLRRAGAAADARAAAMRGRGR